MRGRAPADRGSVRGGVDERQSRTRGHDFPPVTFGSAANEWRQTDEPTARRAIDADARRMTSRARAIAARQHTAAAKVKGVDADLGSWRIAPKASENPFVPASFPAAATLW